MQCFIKIILAKISSTFFYDRYIELYGLRFSKEDHVVLIQLLYEFITVPDLPLCIVSQIYVPLRKLLRFVL